MKFNMLNLTFPKYEFRLKEVNQKKFIFDEIRKKYIPKAELILNEIKNEFLSWIKHRKYIPALNAFKEKIITSEKKESELKVYLNNCFGFQRKQRIAQKITGQIAAYIRENPNQAEETIDLITDVFELNSEKID